MLHFYFCNRLQPVAECVLSYSLLLQATDNDGKGQSAVASLMISVQDSNDNPPQFTNQNYQIAIDEGANKFEPPLKVEVLFFNHLSFN